MTQDWTYLTSLYGQWTPQRLYGSERLTIGGERKEEFDQEQVHCFRRESFRGSFQRAYLLPNNIDTSRIKATMEKGVLEITLPKSERAKAKRIEIGD